MFPLLNLPLSSPSALQNYQLGQEEREKEGGKEMISRKREEEGCNARKRDEEG
jgi:hypothetical protein